jgi:hypothetical protein
MGVNPNQKKTHREGQNPPDLAYRLAFAAMTEDLEYRLHRLAAAEEYLVQCHVTSSQTEADDIRLEQAFGALALAVQGVVEATTRMTESRPSTSLEGSPGVTASEEGL